MQTETKLYIALAICFAAGVALAFLSDARSKQCAKWHSAQVASCNGTDCTVTDRVICDDLTGKR